MTDALRLRLVLEAEVAQAEEALAGARQRLGELAPAAGTAAEAGRRLEAATAAAAQALGRAQTEMRAFSEAARAGGGTDPARALELTANVERARVALAAARGEAAAFRRGLQGAGAGAAAAAPQMGNLVAQINDIGQMIAAGQNPLVLAVQQGTQLSQALGPMGATGAARAFGQALLAALNPVNLAVMGLTAGVAILAQWAIGALRAGDETGDLAATMDALSRATDAALRAGRDAAAPLEEQISRYGRLAGAVRAAIAARRELSAAEAQEQARKAIAAMPLARLGSGATIGAMAPALAELAAARAAVQAELAAAQEALARLAGEGAGGAALGRAQARIEALRKALVDLDLDHALAGRDLPAPLLAWQDALRATAAELGLTEEKALALARAAAALAEAGGGAPRAEAAAALLAEMEAAWGSLAQADAATGGLAGHVARLVQLSAELAAGLGEVGAAGTEGMAGTAAAAGEAGRRLDELTRLRFEIESRGLPGPWQAGALARLEFEAHTPLPADATAGQREAWEAAQKAAAAYAAALAEARAELARLDASDRAEAEIAAFERRAAVARAEAAFGRDSAEAAQARLLAERAAIEEQARAAGLADELRARLIAAWQAAEGLAGVDLASGVVAARAEADALVATLARGVAASQGLAADYARQAEEAELRQRLAGDPVALAGELARRRMEAEQAEARAVADRLERMALDRLRDEAVADARRAAAASLPRGGTGGGTGGGSGGGAAVAGELGELGRLMEALPLKAAQVGERIRAGLMTGAEGAEALAAEQRRVAEGLADLIPLLEALGPAGAASAEEARAALARLAAAIGQGFEAPAKGLGETLDDIFENSFVAWVKGAQDVGQMMADAILTELAKIAYAEVFSPLIQPLLKGLLSIFGLARGGVVAAGAVQPFAAGGLPGLAGFRDRIVEGPTFFGLGGGQAGLMGEAGAEAIMPLLGSVAAPAVRAVLPGGEETAAALTRSASGHLAIRLPGEMERGVRAFAAGGLPGLAGFRDRIVEGPTVFGLGGGQAGLMGEAGAEAIMPLLGSVAAPAVRAVLPGGEETAAALTRSASGHLAIRLPGEMERGVRAFAAGGLPAWLADVPGRAAAAAGGAAAAAGGPGPGQPRALTVNVHNHAAGAAEVGEVRMTGAEGREVLTVMIDRVEQAIAQGLQRGTGRVAAALAGGYGLRRVGR